MILNKLGSLFICTTQLNKCCIILFIILIASCSTTKYPIAKVENKNFSELYNEVRVQLRQKNVYELDSSIFIYDTFEIKSIKKYKNGYYYVVAKKNNDNYPILSFDNIINTDTTRKSKIIKDGDVCVLRLMPLFDDDRLPGDMIFNVLVNYKFVPVSTCFFYSVNVYMSPDVIGKNYYE